MIYLFIGVLFAVLLLGVPIGMSMLISSFSYGMFTNKLFLLESIPERFFTGMSSYALLAISMFMLAAEIMNKGGITASLVKFCQVIIGRRRGALAQVNTGSNVLFAALCGSGAASVSAIGKMLIPAMEQHGYRRDFSTAVTAASAVIGTVIPPSIIMIIYGFVMQVSVGALFAGGIIPGLLLGLGIASYNFYYARKHNIPVNTERYTVKEILLVTKEASWALFTPVLILGSIFSGLATATESAALTVVYTLIVSMVIKKTVKPRDLFVIFIDAARVASQILIIVGAALALSWVMSLSQIPAKGSQLLVDLVPNKYLLLLLFNVLMLILGMFVDATATILITGPIIIPALVSMGVNPIHVGIVFCVNLSIGNITPPFGTCLFVGSKIGNITIEQLFVQVLPFLLIEIAILLLITYVPGISLFIPQLIGY